MTLEVDRISKRFGELRAVDEISFDVRRGEILGFLGPNGAGKTTSIRMVLGIFEPDQGAIRCHLPGASNGVPKQRTGYLPEERGLYADTLVFETLVYFAELKGMSRSDAHTQAESWLDRFDLLDWRKSKIEKLSKGMQQKLQFAAAVVHRPDLIVLDEPFSGLDPTNQDRLKEIIRELRARGASILLSSHQMNQVEALCDRIFLIHRGRRILYGDLDDIKAAHGEHVVQMRFDGQGTALGTLPGVEDLQISGDRATMRLRDTTEPDAFLRALPVSVRVREISLTRPPLHDIFVRATGGRGDETT